MEIYKNENIGDLLSANAYPGRGIVIGKSKDGTKAVFAYFIMGRSENSRNRVFVAKGDDVTIYPFDASKVGDPSLIIYSPVRHCNNMWIVTNGDQTDTIYYGLSVGKTFAASLESRAFEPDSPNFTPRISGLLNLSNMEYSYKLSILKSADEVGSSCNRFTYSYQPLNGVGHFIHTYECDGNPIPTFQGEPKRVEISNSIDEFASEIWTNLNENNKVSLFVRYIDLKTNAITDKMFNKNVK
ncbi:MAG: IMP cyclohydrolase [Clostridia bacterium]